MNNPFDKEKQKVQHEFFNQFTESVNNWMIAKYPEFDSNLENKIKFIENRNEILLESINEHKRFLEKEKHDYLIDVIKQINQFLEKDYPDIDGNLKKMSKKIERNIIQCEETIKNVISSNSIYEDINQLKSEYKEIKMFIDGFKNNIKKVLDI